MLTLATSGLSAHQRVIAGIGFLDKTSPGWRNKIDRDTLDIRYDCTCAIAQVHGSFNDNVGKDRLIKSHKQAADLGFYAYCHGTAGERAEYAALTKAWRHILAAEDAVRQLAKRQLPAAHRIAKTA